MLSPQALRRYIKQINLRVEAFSRLTNLIFEFIESPRARRRVPEHLGHFGLGRPEEERIYELGVVCACAIDTAMARYARTQLALKMRPGLAKCKLDIVINKSSAVASLDRLARDTKEFVWEKAWIETSYEARRALHKAAKNNGLTIQFQNDQFYPGPMPMPIPDRTLITKLLPAARKIAVTDKSKKPQADHAEEEIFRAYKLLAERPVLKDAPNFLRGVLNCYLVRKGDAALFPKDVFRGLTSKATLHRLSKRWHDDPIISMPKLTRSDASPSNMRWKYTLELIFPAPN